MTRPAGATLLTAMSRVSAVATIGVALGMKSLWNVSNILKCISVIIYSLPPEKRDELVSSDESGKETFKLSPMDTGRIIAGFIQSSLRIIPPSEVSSLPPDVRQRNNQKHILHDAAYFHLHDRLGHLDRSGSLLPGLLFNISTPDGVKKALHVLTSSLQGLCSLWLITPDAARRSGNPTNIPAIASCIESCLQSRQFYVDTHRLLQNLAVRMFGDSVDLSTLGGVNDVLSRIDSALRALLSLNDLVPSSAFFRSDNPQGLVDAIHHSVRSTAISAASTAQQEIFAQLRTFLVAVPDFNIVSFDGNATTQGKVSIIAHYVASLFAERHRVELDIFGEIRPHFLGLPDFDINRFDGSDNSAKIAMISEFIASILAQHRQRPAQAAQNAQQDLFGEIRPYLVNIPRFDINRFDRSSDAEKIAMIASFLAQHRQRPAQSAEQEIFGEIRSHLVNIPGFDIRRFDGSDNATKVAMLSRLITSMQVDINNWCRQAHCAEDVIRQETNRANRAEVRATDMENKWKAHVASCRQEQQAKSPSARLKSDKVSQMVFGGALIGALATVMLVLAGLWAPTPLAVVTSILGGFWTQSPEGLSCFFLSNVMSPLEDVALYLGQKCLGHSCDEGAPPPRAGPKPSHQDVLGSPPPADVELPAQHDHHEQTHRHSHADEAELEEEAEVEEPPAPEEPSFADPQPQQSSSTAADPSSHNLYERIGTNASASSADIKKAYRTASLRFHPDKVLNKTDSAAIEQAKRDMFRINQAKEILLDADLRERYDTGTLKAGVDYDFE